MGTLHGAKRGERPLLLFTVHGYNLAERTENAEGW